jgi:hypothetical protein
MLSRDVLTAWCHFQPDCSVRPGCRATVVHLHRTLVPTTTHPVHLRHEGEHSSARHRLTAVHRRGKNIVASPSHRTICITCSSPHRAPQPTGRASAPPADMLRLVPILLLCKQSEPPATRGTEAAARSSHCVDTTSNKSLQSTSGPAATSPSTPPACCFSPSHLSPSSAATLACHRDPSCRPTTLLWRGSFGEHLHTLSPKMGSPHRRLPL